MTRLQLTTSWDDGHPLDLRLAGVLAEHGFAGTFYVPRRNVEGRPVMTGAQLRELAVRFEVGGHSIDHVRLPALPPKERERQIADGKRQLEDELGQRIAGFCYPGGAYDQSVCQAVRSAGYEYARTITNLSFDRNDRFRVPTTIQLYPHSRGTLARNFVSGRDWRRRAHAFRLVLAHRSLAARLEALLELALEHGGVFHLWGHSWEIDEHGLWGDLERFLRRASAVIPPEQRATNRQAYA